MTQGLATFTGVDYVQRCKYARTLGITPDVAAMDCLPQATTVPADGTLTMTFGATVMVMPGCRVDYARLRMTMRGHVLSLRIFDRRWLWRFGWITGHYNQWNPDGTIDASVEKTPRDLATLLFDAMNEPVYDVSALPNTERPTVDWEYDNPAEALLALCRDRGCDISLGNDNVPRIVLLGIGAALPTGSEVQSASYTIDSPEAPYDVKVVCARTRYQSKLKLEAVGLDNDGTVKAIDDLSYKPAIGWESEAPGSFFGVADEADRALAEQTVWKWYRAVSQADGTQDVPGYDDGTGSSDVGTIDKILPLLPHLVETYTDVDGSKRSSPAYTEGTAYPASVDPISVTNTPVHTRLNVPFTLDATNGIVKFSRPIYKLDAVGNVPADVFLVCSYHVRHSVHHQFVHYSLNRVVGGTSGTAVTHREDIEHTFYATYHADKETLDTAVDNLPSITGEVSAHLDVMVASYAAVASGVVHLRGLIDQSTDGALRQVMWSVDHLKGATTTVSRNSENEIGVMRAVERERLMWLRGHVRGKQYRRSAYRQRRLLDEGVL